METTDQQRIAALTAQGQWGTETLHGLLAKHALNRPDHLAFKDQPNRQQLNGEKSKQLSWAELDRASDNLARQLQAAGLGEDARIIIQLPNIVELPLMYYTLSKMGAIASPVPIQYGSHELQHMATALKASAMITIGRFGKSELAKDAKKALPDLNVLVFDEDLRLDTSEGEGFSSIAADEANRVLSICWTSGTTGTPKGVPRSHNMWLASGRCTASSGNYVAEDRLLCPFPMVNMSALGGFVFPAALHGSSIILHHPLDPPLYLKQLQDERITFSIAPPALLNQLAKNPSMWAEFDFSALRRVGSGSAPLAPWMIETFGKDFGVDIVNIYGSNEGIGLYSTPESVPDPEIRAAMFPRPESGDVIHTKVADPETGEEVIAAGARGELLISGATVFDGYYDHDNQGVFSQDGYFRTGDLVEICGEGGNYYRIAGRCKDIINRGGMKISPFEIDSALEQHPDLLEAAVCAYPDERLGEKICACLVMKPGVELMTMDALQQHLLAVGLAKFKLPERIVAYDALPRNALGKVQRFELQDAVSAKPAS
jgi:acyl-CoA synthetase (AMP-forming)/AMP-acid ligase II